MSDTVINLVDIVAKQTKFWNLRFLHSSERIIDGLHCSKSFECIKPILTVLFVIIIIIIITIQRD